MIATTCDYCGRTEQYGGVCTQCGAPRANEQAKPARSEIDPPGFAYMGHWIVIERDWGGPGEQRWRFYAGPDLMAIIPIDRRVLEELFPPKEFGVIAEDDPVLRFMWELYLLAVGEQRDAVLIKAIRNRGIRPVRLEIKCITDDPDPEQHYSMGQTYRQLAQLRDRVMA